MRNVYINPVHCLSTFSLRSDYHHHHHRHHNWRRFNPSRYRDKIVTLLLIRREAESPQEVACKFSSERTWVRSTCRRFVACTHLSPACIAALRTLHPPPSPIHQAHSSLLRCFSNLLHFLWSRDTRVLERRGCDRKDISWPFSQSLSITREVSDILNENESL